jgi:hypothetical protein
MPPSPLSPTSRESLRRCESPFLSSQIIGIHPQSSINTPFELLKKDINDTFAGIEFQGSALPVPQQNRLAFCDKMDTSVVDNIGRDIIKAFKIGILILFLLALLLIGLNCLLTWWKWRCMKSHLEYTRQAWMTDPTMAHAKGSTMDSTPQVTLNDHNLMVLNANSEHPLVTRITNQVSQKLRLKPRNHTKLQWFFNYIFHPPAVACLLIGVFGLLLIEVQLLAMGPMVDKYKGQAADSARDFSLFIADSINQSMLNQSAEYAREVNLKVDNVQTTINDGVFGWVGVTTTQINTTINEFYTDLTDGVDKVFGGTILATPASEFIRCLIGSKVDAIENALTFLHDNLKVDMPRVNETVLILSPETVNEASAPIAAAAIGGGGNGGEDDGGLVGRLVNGYANQLKKERITFGIFLGIWGIVVLMGLGVILWHSFGAPALERRRRDRYLREQREALPEAYSVPQRDGAATPQGDRLNLTNGSDVKDPQWNGGAVATNDLPQFTPLPSPHRTAFRPFWRSGAAAQEDGIHHEAVSTESLATTGDKPNLKTRMMSLRNTGKRDAEAQKEGEGQGDGWLGRVRKSIFGGKKEEEAGDYDFWEKYKNRPQLKIVVDTASDRTFVVPRPDPEPAPKSRWSASPTESSTLGGWRSIMSLSSKKDALETPIVSQIPPRRRVPPPPGLRHNPSVPSDIGASPDDPFRASFAPPSTSNHARTTSDPFNNPASIVPPTYPIPLHSAYQGAPSPLSTRPSPTRSPRTSPSTHKRVSSAPMWRVTNGSPADQASVSSTDSPRATLKQPAGLGGPADEVNPFVTPFDDEHRVQIVKPGVTRKSLKADNPFGGMAL